MKSPSVKVRMNEDTQGFVVDSSIIRIGRARDCDLRSEDRGVSRHHCELVVDGDQMTVRDLQSSNGTFVNGERIVGDCVLRDGDLLSISTTKYRIAKHAVHHAKSLWTSLIAWLVGNSPAGRAHEYRIHAEAITDPTTQDTSLKERRLDRFLERGIESIPDSDPQSFKRSHYGAPVNANSQFRDDRLKLHSK